MQQQTKPWRFGKLISYVLVAAAAAFLSFAYCEQVRRSEEDKLSQLTKLIESRFVGEYDPAAVADAAAAAMVDALGDRWSYYIPASEYASHMEQLNNEYVGVGITVRENTQDKNYEIIAVDPAGGAREAGVMPGDLLIGVDGQPVADMEFADVKNRIRGERETQVTLQLSRDGNELTVTVTRRLIQLQVATGQLLEDGIGLVRIVNFDDRCAQETVAVIEDLVAQGAQSLIFDVRFNPGGFRHELVELLDYLLPEGMLFRSVAYDGTEETDVSDAACLKMPMAVLINGDSYSAAEFFAAALSEYSWATLVGEPTVGKGYFQNTIRLGDGSAVGLSVGKYYTPNGISLAETGGLIPEVTVEVEDEVAADIYAGYLAADYDPQIQVAMELLREEKGRK